MYKRAWQGWIKHLDFIVLDVLCLHLAFLAAYFIRHGFSRSPYVIDPYSGLALLMTVVDFSVAALLNSMHNVMRRGMYKEFAATVKHSLIVFGILIIYMFSVKESEEYSRISLYLMLGFHVLIGWLVRMLWKKFVVGRRSPSAERSMVIVCSLDDAADVVEHMQQISHENLRLTGIVLTDGEAEEVSGVPVVADLSGAARYICSEWVDEVFFAPNCTSPEAQKLCAQCREMGVVIHEALSIQNEKGNRQFVEKIGNYQVLTSSVNYATPLQMMLKRLMDIAGGLCGVVLTGLILLVIGPKIKKESPGPMLFSQMRVGQNGKRFKIYKIRSMYMDAEERKQELMSQNRIADGMMFKMDFDPRIIGNEILPDGTRKTGIGDLIRRTSLDEFPQFLNVLKGDMSLVGTRPPTVDEWERYELHHRARLAFKPGITGMWQISGRSEIVDFEEVVKLDTQYIYNWSMGLDLRILLQTVKTVLGKEGAM